MPNIRNRPASTSILLEGAEISLIHSFKPTISAHASIALDPTTIHVPSPALPKTDPSPFQARKPRICPFSSPDGNCLQEKIRYS